MKCSLISNTGTKGPFALFTFGLLLPPNYYMLQYTEQERQLMSSRARPQVALLRAAVLFFVLLFLFCPRIKLTR